MKLKFLIKTKNWFILILPICSIFYISCNDEKRDNIKQDEKQNKDTLIGYSEESGDSLKYIIPTKDGKRHGISKWYYHPANKIEGLIEYHNDKQDGIRIHFYSNGTIKEKGFFVKGEEEGYRERFFPTGYLKAKVFYVDDKPFSHAYYYYSNGKLKKYAAFDFQGHVRFIRKYDSIGNIIKEDGTALGQLLFDEKNKLFLKFTYAKPPATVIKVKAEIFKEDKIETKPISLDKRTGLISFESPENVAIIGELKDSLNNEIIDTDTLFYPDKTTVKKIETQLKGYPI